MKTQEVEAQREWPKYQSHKRVHALKLKRVSEDDAAVGHTEFVPAEPGYGTLVFPNHTEAVKRCKALETGDPGYLVTYEDGFTSWSPTRVFENGYTRLDA